MKEVLIFSVFNLIFFLIAKNPEYFYAISSHLVIQLEFVFYLSFYFCTMENLNVVSQTKSKARFDIISPCKSAS